LSGAGEAVRAVTMQILDRTHHARHFIHPAPLQPLVRCPVSGATSCSQVAILTFAKSKRVWTAGAITSRSDQRPPLHHTRHIAAAATPQHKIAARRCLATRSPAGAPGDRIEACLGGVQASSSPCRAKLPDWALRAGADSAARWILMQGVPSHLSPPTT